ncbi:MAG: helix-turn-helix transcriptional regulator [Candidatus Melainabacteria bacterium]|nr:helix-turn-helix transcriptional regulator [Candidatus Melainabacteria bacterium]
MEFDVEHGSGNVFKDIGYSDSEAANLMARAELMLKVRDIIQENGWTQREAARILGVGQPRVAEIMSFNTKYFSVDLLLKYLSKLGMQVEFSFKNTDVA